MLSDPLAKSFGGGKGQGSGSGVQGSEEAADQRQPGDCVFGKTDGDVGARRRIRIKIRIKNPGECEW